jgi:hypothetical protein
MAISTTLRIAFGYVAGLVTIARVAPSVARVDSASLMPARSIRCSVDQIALPSEPKPIWFTTKSVRSSFESAIALGAQPVGIRPSRCRCSGSRASITAIASRPRIAT